MVTIVYAKQLIVIILILKFTPQQAMELNRGVEKSLRFEYGKWKLIS